MATPFVKWAGGKRSLIKQYEPYFPEQFNVYYEPFLGGGAVFFHLKPRFAVLSDCNEELMMAWRVIQSAPLALMQNLDSLLRAVEQQGMESYYYILRHAVYEKPINRAARFLFLNKTGFNGLYRVNKRGEFNVPYGKYKNPRIYDEENIQLCHEALRDAELHTASFSDMVLRAKKGDFAYLDPPYDGTFSNYIPGGWVSKNQILLKKVCDLLDQAGVKFMLSNSDNEFVRGLYSNYRMIEMQNRRNIACKSESRAAKGELLVLNY